MNEKRLTYIAVMSASLHGLLVSFVLAYPCVAMARFFQGFDPQRAGTLDRTAWWALWIVMPVVIAVFGGIMTTLFCLAYNLSAKLLGGVRYKDQT